MLGSETNTFKPKIPAMYDPPSISSSINEKNQNEIRVSNSVSLETFQGIHSRHKDEDYKLHARKPVTLAGTKITELPCMFATCAESFDCSNNKLKSLKGCPEYVGGFFDASANLLKSLEHVPSYISGTAYFTGNPSLRSLVGIGKQIKFVHILKFGPFIKQGGIGVLLIDGIKKIEVAYPSFNSKRTPWIDAVDIINEYIPKGSSGILQCQEELIDAGLDVFAEL